MPFRRTTFRKTTRAVCLKRMFLSHCLCGFAGICSNNNEERQMENTQEIDLNKTQEQGGLGNGNEGNSQHAPHHHELGKMLAVTRTNWGIVQ